MSTLAGLLLFAITNQTWFDPIAGFVIAACTIWEGVEAWKGELVDDDSN